jgi:hypothetical protein
MLFRVLAVAKKVRNFEELMRPRFLMSNHRSIRNDTPLRRSSDTPKYTAGDASSRGTGIEYQVSLRPLSVVFGFIRQALGQALIDSGVSIMAVSDARLSKGDGTTPQAPVSNSNAEATGNIANCKGEIFAERCSDNVIEVDFLKQLK